VSQRPFKKLLVANRGEIACRVIQTARALGYRTVAVFSEADRRAPHVRAADEAVCIGPPKAAESYLDIDKILDACRKTGADALHPGYGFLSENAELVERCEQAGVRFVGPPEEAVRLLGDKARAKTCMAAAGVPVVPGYHGTAQSDAALAEEALHVGFPVLIKAAAGGGGRGMRIARSAADLPELLRSARREAEATFGSGALLLERLLDEARHVEIQIFGDTQGHVIHLGERECSVQRRHQKIIEESPSLAVDAALRARMGAAAVKAAQAAGYFSAGTVEFLLALDGQFFFLEMNTRLQVEHPVTELVTGLDLVAWQLSVAEGGELPLSQDEVVQRGHAIEARLYAEDPDAGFLPQSGRLLLWRTPRGEGVRVDAGVETGQEVTPFYDPLLAKVIAHAETRELARRRLWRALGDTVVLGPVTNRELLISLLEDPLFVEGKMTTRTVDERFARASPARASSSPEHAALAAVLHSLPPGGADPWRSNGQASWPVWLEAGSAKQQLRVTALATGSYEVQADSGPGMQVRLETEGFAERRLGGELHCEIDGVLQKVHYARGEGAIQVQLGACAASFTETLRAHDSQVEGAASGRVVAPITGQVLGVSVKAGERVERGQPLVTLAAMKMEHRVVAPIGGAIARVAVAVGEQVAARQVLVEIEAEDSSAVRGAAG
jgi:geranyl-CoA carboxylase alpha subunit